MAINKIRILLFLTVKTLTEYIIDSLPPYLSPSLPDNKNIQSENLMSETGIDDS